MLFLLVMIQLFFMIFFAVLHHYATHFRHTKPKVNRFNPTVGRKPRENQKY